MEYENLDIENEDNSLERLDFSDDVLVDESDNKDPYANYNVRRSSSYDEDDENIESVSQIDDNIEELPVSEKDDLMEYNHDFFANNANIDFNPEINTEPIVEQEKKKGLFKKKDDDSEIESQKKNFINEEVINEPKQVEIKYNPLNNGTNPIPVNPVAPVEEIIDISYDEGKVNIFTFFSMVLGMVIKPGRTVEKSLNSYQQIKSGILITIFMMIFALILYMIPKLYLSGFTKAYDIGTGSYYSVYKIDLIFQQNFLQLILTGLFFSTISILLLSLIYYATSFFTSIGVTFTKLLVLFNLCFIPFILFGLFLAPLAYHFNSYVGLALLIASILYSIVIMFITLNHALLIKNTNKEIYYNMFNLSLYIVIMVIVYILFNGNLISI